MYIFKNALKCIGRAKVRNMLIGIIVFMVSISSCVGLSIRRATEKAKEETLSTMSVTASISFDRRGAMENMTPPTEGGQGGFDREQFSSFMGENSNLTLEEYEKYAKASTVKDFYYTSSVSLNGNDELEPVTNDEEENANIPQMDFGGGKDGRDFIKGAQSDFSLIGVSGEDAMTDFINGNSSITDGQIFEENTTELQCIISDELATFNSLAVDDEITLINPNAEDESYTLKIVGLFTDSSANENIFSGMGMTSNDPANIIYISYNALNSILEKSASLSQTVTDDDTNREYETALNENLSATYTFSTVEDYETFETEVYTLGLSNNYTVSSQDITQFENSMTPLETLSQTAGYFLLVILCIGAVVLVVLNIFSVRERKYEIGVLTAMGMKKGKVAFQFLTEIFVITLTAVIIATGAGAALSVPVANALLESQIEATSSRKSDIEQGFGRGDIPNNGQMQQPPQNMGGGFGGKFEEFMGNTADYVDEISASADFTVLLQLLAIAVVLTLIAGAFSVLFIMRYEPLKILSNRD